MGKISGVGVGDEGAACHRCRPAGRSPNGTYTRLPMISTPIHLSPTHPLTHRQVAMGFLRVANETMCRPIRALTQMKVGGAWVGGLEGLLSFRNARG